MRNLIILIAIGVIFSLSSCTKETASSMAPPAAQVTTPPVAAQITKTDQLKVASDFNWKTTKEILLTLTGTSNSLVEVASANNSVYERAYLSKDLAYTMKLTVPSYETSVHLLYLGKDVNVALNSNNIDYKFN